VNTAVGQIDKVTQSNAAAAEESASAAEEMNAQAAELNTLVGELLVMVGGRHLHNPEGKAGAAQAGGKRRIRSRRLPPGHPSPHRSGPRAHVKMPAPARRRSGLTGDRPGFAREGADPTIVHIQSPSGVGARLVRARFGRF